MGFEERRRAREIAKAAGYGEVPIVGEHAEPLPAGEVIVPQVIIHALVICGTCPEARPMIVSPPSTATCTGCGKVFVLEHLELTTDTQTGKITSSLNITRLEPPRVVAPGPEGRQ